LCWSELHPDGPEEPILFELLLQLLPPLFVGGQLKMLDPAFYRPPQPSHCVRLWLPSLQQ